MRTMRVPGFVFATLAGLTLAACQLALGFGDKDFSNGNTGGTSTHSTTTSTGGSSTTGMGGMGATVGTGGVHPHDGGPDADAGMERGVWSVHAAAVTNKPLVSSIAVSPVNGNVFVTGSGDPTKDLGCPTIMTDADAGVGPAPGYLVELDSMSGACKWAFVFGTSAQGTGVAVDSNGNVALTGAFNGDAYLSGPWPATPPWPPAATPGNTSSFVIVFSSARTVTWARAFGSNVTTTGIAANGATIAVSGYYIGGNIAVSGPPMSPPADDVSISMGSGDVQDGFLIWFKTDGTYITDLEITGNLQSANAVALDVNSVVAATGITQGSTEFNGPPAVPAPSANTIFAMAYSASKTAKFQAIFGGGSKQNGSCVAFDLMSNLLVGGQFTGTVGVLAQGMDAGTSYTAPSAGKSVIVAQYDPTGTPGNSLAFGSATSDTSIGGVAPYNNATVALAGGFAGMAQLTFGMTTAKSVMSAGTHKNVYVAQLDATLSTVKWLEPYGDGTGDQVADAVAVDPNGGDIVIAGSYQGKLAFGGMGSPLTNATGNDEIFVAKLKP